MENRNKKIIDLYLNNPELTIEDIANKFNISKATVSRIARINNLPRRTGNSGQRLTLDQEKEIVNKYLSSIPLIELQKEYKISYDRLKNIIQKYSKDYITSSKRLNPKLIENYFENIDSAEKAYWLGWIISDGAITNQPEKSKFQLEITLKQEDEDILHLLEKDLGVENKVYTSATLYKRFSLGCKKIILDLEKLGITQNKSFTVKIPKINKKFNSALIRGIFDGDGGFTSYKRKNGQNCQELSFWGNEFVINKIREILLEEIPNLTPNQITKESSIKRIRWSSKKDIELLKKYLYTDCNCHYLKRKYNLINANTELTN